MRFLVIAALFAAAMALPEGRRLRPEEHWRPAQGRDLSKYKPKHATVPKSDGEESWEEQMIRINKAAAELRASGAFSSKKGTTYNLAEECGIEGPAKDKIVGGTEATEHAWPWQVALFIDNAWFCGGSIVNENYVLTAAHCADGAGFFDVMAGAHNVRASSEPNRVEITSYNGWTHPGWNSQNLANDLAIIELPSALPFNDYIKPSCLPMKGDAAGPGDLVGVTGWGKPSDNAGGISDVLRQVLDLPVISNKDCNDVYGIVGDGIVCINTAGGKGSCNGDSGGPLITKTGGLKSPGQKWNQVGIVSFGASAGCEAGLPAGFTRTEYYIDYINEQTGM